MKNSENLFSFNYEVFNLKNRDEEKSDSRYSVVYGEGGKIIHTKKDSYQVVSTEALSTLGNAFIEKGYKVQSFTHKSGEVIGLTIPFGKRATVVGDKTYKAVITVPNNGGGKGYLTLKETRLICTNGMVRTVSNNKGEIKIPHTIGYEESIKLMQDSLEQFTIILNTAEKKDLDLSETGIKGTTARKLLNDWFFNHEMPESHKKDLTLDQFREKIYNNPEEIKSIDRYNQLMDAYKREIEFNEELGLKLSKYTVYATITNYLSRRVEASKSTAPEEVKFARSSAKLEAFEKALA